MNDIIEVESLIRKVIEELGKEGKRSEELIEAKAKTTCEYDRMMGISTANLKAEGTQATLIDKIAKERCHKALYDKIVAEETLKAHYSRISRLESILNGYQSIFRHLQSVSRESNGYA